MNLKMYPQSSFSTTLFIKVESANVSVQNGQISYILKVEDNREASCHAVVPLCMYAEIYSATD